MATSQAERDAYKVMRRGTRACRECRRRKIKCIHDDDSSVICQECTAHNRDCVKQGNIRGSNSKQSSRSVKVQVTRLESAVEKLARESATADVTKPTGGLSFLRDHVTGEEHDLAVLEQQFKKRSPIFSLFNNEILHQTGSLEAYESEFSSQIKFPDSNASDKVKLLSTIANVPDIFKVLHSVSDWWISWREQHFALRKAAGHLSLHDFVRARFEEDSPAAVALGCMAIAMALGQLRPGIDDLSFNLPVPANHIMNYILAAIDQVVCDSDKYQAQSDSILLFMMRAKHHMENNQLRKAWLRIRQGIRCAQAISFGTPSPIDVALSEEEAEQQRFIAAIFEVDHLVSMVLGFPHAKDTAFTDARAFAVLLNPSADDEELRMRALRRVVAVNAGHVNDRNASGQISDEETESTQQTLEMAAAAMPPGWWYLLSQPLSGLAAYRYESIMVQLWYWTVQSYLHMPYLINPSEVGPSPHYRKLCLEGARNLIRSFNYLRAEPAISVYMCNCDDFQALLGACILLVGVLQDVSKDVSSTGPAPSNVDADLALVEELKIILSYRMQQQGGGISKQGLAVLDELTCFLYDDDDLDSPANASKGQLSGTDLNINKHQKTIMLPYFGTIKIELTKKLPKRKSRDHSQHMILTPPQSVDGLQSNYSPVQFLIQETTPPSIYDVPGTGLYFSTSTLLPDPNSTMACTDNSDCTFFPSLPIHDGYPTDISFDELPTHPIAFEDWNNYMFDQELDQEWNPGLQWGNNFGTN